MNTTPRLLIASILLAFVSAQVQAESPALLPLVHSRVEAEFASLEELYKDLHAHPELSFQEKRSSGKVAEGLRAAGCDVTANVGGYGVVGVFRNGAGPTVLVRSDMDALPVKEQTGLPFASTVRTKDDKGEEVGVMHACGHDMHMTCLVGTARVLVALKDRWQGTLLFIGQPAEERVSGAKAMLKDGLFTRFPKPDICVAMHVSSDLPAGSLGYTEGFAMASSDSVDILVRGIGGHGAMPHTTKDPVVLASQIVLALQTIVSRETRPTEPSVVTVGSIHGGSKHNIIPDDVKLQLTLRSYSDAVREHQIAAIKRITRGLAQAAGLPEELMPVVTLGKDGTKSTYNDPALTQRLVKTFGAWFGKENIKTRPPSMGAEDFGLYAHSAKVPGCMFWLGAVEPARWQESERTGKPLPSLHNSRFHPLREPTLKTGLTAMTAAVLELMGKR
ncbi:MAG: amidohydrolase [Verrucomicrobia bacterium]|nr:amidohydrolase [Verrucomicrobiota bacterium]